MPRAIGNDGNAEPAVKAALRSQRSRCPGIGCAVEAGDPAFHSGLGVAVVTYGARIQPGQCVAALCRALAGSRIAGAPVARERASASCSTQAPLGRHADGVYREITCAQAR